MLPDDLRDPHRTVVDPESQNAGTDAGLPSPVDPAKMRAEPAPSELMLGRTIQQSVIDHDADDLRPAIQRMLDADEPYVLDVVVPYTEHVLPFIPTAKTVAEMIWKP